MKFNKKQKRLGFVFFLILLALVFVPGSPLSFYGVTNFESPDVQINAIRTPSESFEWSDTVFCGDFGATHPDFCVELSQPQPSECFDSHWYDFLSAGDSCLVQEPIILNEYREGDDKVELWQYKYKFWVFYSASGSWEEELLGIDVDNYQIDFTIDYKNQPVTFKHLTVTQFLKCTDSKCDSISIRPVDGSSSTVYNSYRGFTTYVDYLPINTDASQSFELEIESSKRLENFYVESENPPITEDALDYFRAQGLFEGMTDWIAIIIIIVFILVIAFAFLYLLIILAVIKK